MVNQGDTKETKDYYHCVEDYDWVEAADSLKGPESVFHWLRDRVMKKLIFQAWTLGIFIWPRILIITTLE